MFRSLFLLGSRFLWKECSLCYRRYEAAMSSHLLEFHIFKLNFLVDFLNSHLDWHFASSSDRSRARDAFWLPSFGSVSLASCCSCNKKSEWRERTQWSRRSCSASLENAFRSSLKLSRLIFALGGQVCDSNVHNVKLNLVAFNWHWNATKKLLQRIEELWLVNCAHDAWHWTSW